MKLLVERSYVEAMIDRFPELSGYAEQLKFGNRVEMPGNGCGARASGRRSWDRAA